MRTLWGMPREQRLRLWEALGRYGVALEVLELGDSSDMAHCPLDDDEMRVVMQVVLPEGLNNVRVLYLRGLDKLTDAGVKALAAAGCGKNLTSLCLECECLFWCLAFLCFLFRVLLCAFFHALLSPCQAPFSC